MWIVEGSTAAFRVSYPMLKDYARAEECAQNAVEDVILSENGRKGPAGFNGRSHFVGCCGRQAYYLALRELRKRKGRARLGGHVEQPNLDDDPLVIEETLSAIRECLDSLEPKLRTIIINRFFEGRILKDIGDGTLSNNRRHLEKGLEILRKCMKSKLGEGGMDGGHPDSGPLGVDVDEIVISALQSVVSADRDGRRISDMAPNQRQLLEAHLEQVLVDSAALDTHCAIVEQMIFGRAASLLDENLRAWPEGLGNRVLNHGVRGLSLDELSRVALGLIGLIASNERIATERPEHWSAIFAREKSNVPHFDVDEFLKRLDKEVAAGPRISADRSERHQFASAWLRAAIVLMALLPGVLNWVIAAHQASVQRVSLIDSMHTMQSVLESWGLGIALVLAAFAGIAGIFARLRQFRRFAIGSLVALVLLSLAAYIYAGNRRQAESQRLDSLFIKHRWVAFDSPAFDPQKNPRPTLEVLTNEMKVLHDQGEFDGIITFHFSPEMIRAAAAARFQAVIAGIYVAPDGTLSDEFDDAIKFERNDPNARIVVAYSVGHDVSVSTPLATIAAWMSSLRQATGKPVSTTFPATCYLGSRGQDIRSIGDFYMPDIHGDFYFGTTPADMLRQTRQSVESLSELSDKPVMLTMLMYPSGPQTDSTPGLTEDNQARFFRGIIRDLYLPSGMHLSVFGGFDLPWKGASDQWDPSEQFVGLFRADGTPKPAARIVASPKWPIQSRP